MTDYNSKRQGRKVFCAELAEPQFLRGPIVGVE